MRSVGTVLALVVLATLVATFARRWRIPGPSLLVVAGLAVALLPGTPQIEISPGIIRLVVLPPLLEGAELQTPYDEHRISDTTRRRLRRSLDLEEARLADA